MSCLQICLLGDRGEGTTWERPGVPLVLAVWEMFEKVTVMNRDWWGMPVLVHTLTEFLPLAGRGRALES